MTHGGLCTAETCLGGCTQISNVSDVRNVHWCRCKIYIIYIQGPCKQRDGCRWATATLHDTWHQRYDGANPGSKGRRFRASTRAPLDNIPCLSVSLSLSHPPTPTHTHTITRTHVHMHMHMHARTHAPSGHSNESKRSGPFKRVDHDRRRSARPYGAVFIWSPRYLYGVCSQIDGPCWLAVSTPHF